MGLAESIGAASAAEKIGWLALAGGFFVTCAKVVKWFYNFQTEHDAFKKHLIDAEPLMPRFIVMEQEIAHAKRERVEMLEEIRGLRRDISAVLNAMLERG